MAVRVRPLTLWRSEVSNQAGALARTLEPLAGSNLEVVMGYRLPGDPARAAIEVASVTGPRATAAAQGAGLSDSGIAALSVDGEDRPGLGHAIARALGDAGINMEFLVGLVTGGRHSTVIGFESREDAERAVPLLRKAAAAPRAGAGKKSARKAAPRGGARGRTPPRKRAGSRRRSR